MMIKIPQGFIAILMKIDQLCCKSLGDVDHHAKNNIILNGNINFLIKKYDFFQDDHPIHPYLPVKYAWNGTGCTKLKNISGDPNFWKFLENFRFFFRFLAVFGPFWPFFHPRTPQIDLLIPFFIDLDRFSSKSDGYDPFWSSVFCRYIFYPIYFLFQ